MPASPVDLGCNVNKCTSSGSCTPDPMGDERRGDERRGDEEGGDGDDGDGEDEDGEGEGEEKNMMGGLFSCCASPGH